MHSWAIYTLCAISLAVRVRYSTRHYALLYFVLLGVCSSVLGPWSSLSSVSLLPTVLDIAQENPIGTSEATSVDLTNGSRGRCGGGGGGGGIGSENVVRPDMARNAIRTAKWHEAEAWAERRSAGVSGIVGPRLGERAPKYPSRFLHRCAMLAASAAQHLLLLRRYLHASPVT